MSRYKDSYLLARTITTFGSIVKFLAFLVGGVIALIALSQGSQYVVIGVALGIFIVLPIYILGVLVSAMGQILKATLDTAVNTSPLITKDEMRQIMSLD